MPLLKKKPFERLKPPPGLKPDDEVFFCEATGEVFSEYEPFFERTILCNSLVWTCAITGKSSLTFEDALDSEKKARKRLGTVPKQLKKALLYLTSRTKRGRITDLVDDVYVFACNRFFKGEHVEGVVNDQWCDCKILRVIAPTEEDIAKDAEEEKEELAKEAAEAAANGGSPKTKPKEKKRFSPYDHLFKYEIVEIEPDDPNSNEPRVVGVEDVRREKGTYTREKNLLFLKNSVDLANDGNFKVKRAIAERYGIDSVQFSDIFAGPEPVFEETKRVKGMAAFQFTAKKKVEPGRKVGKGTQGTLDSWVKGGGQSLPASAEKPKGKKQSAAEIEAEMKRMREQNARFKEELRVRTEEAKKRKLEEKAKEKERKKEEKKLLHQLLNEWKLRRDDLECEDLAELPKPKPVHCKIPNRLFGDFLTLLEFFNDFASTLEIKDTFGSAGVTFDTLEQAVTDEETLGGALYEIISVMLGALFDLQDEEDEEVKADKYAAADVNDLDKNVLGKDEDVAAQIKSATLMTLWPSKTQGVRKLRELHLDQFSLTEILRLHLEMAGAARNDRLHFWMYQQRGGFRLADDPGLQFRMEEPQILEALTTRTVYELGVGEKLKLLTCLMQQILSFATVRDEIDEKYNELNEAKYELRAHQIAENKRIKAAEEAGKVKRREERLQKKEEELKEKEKESKEETEESKKANSLPGDVHLTERQRLALQAQKEKEEKQRQRKEETLKAGIMETERQMQERVAELQAKAGLKLLGRDRAYRRFWTLETLPGLFVEHDDDLVGCCLQHPTPFNPNAGPMDEDTAMKRVKEIMNSNGKSSDEKSSSDKENDHKEEQTAGESSKTYQKKSQTQQSLKQKVLSAKNGAMALAGSSSAATASEEDDDVVEVIEDSKEDIKKIDQDGRPWGLCLADPESCPVHSTILPKTYWAYYSSVEELDDLIEKLNPRGLREGDLKDKLTFERDTLVRTLKKFSMSDRLDGIAAVKKEKKQLNGDSWKTTPRSVIDISIRDNILELEEKLYLGSLGQLRVRDREAWQKAIQDQGYDRQCESLSWGGRAPGETPFESRLPSANPSRAGSPVDGEDKRDSSGSAVDREERRKVRDLACAMLQVSQMIDVKFLKSPLGEDEKDKKKRLKDEEKRKKDRDAAEEEGATYEESEKTLTKVEAWENSLMSCTSYAQLFVHLTTLESSINFSKSLLNAKCRICRRKGDDSKMLLCDGCDRGHHMYCLKPKLKNVPTGNWYCNECKPKERNRSPKKRSRRAFNEDDDDEDVKDSNSRRRNAAKEEEVDGETDNDDDEEDENMEVDQNDSSAQNSDDDEDDEIPLKKRKLATKKSKKEQKAPEASASSSSKNSRKSIITRLLGKRKCAAEASERIAHFSSQELHSSNSSDNDAEADSDSDEASPSSRETRTRSSRRQQTNDAKKVAAAAAAPKRSPDLGARAKRRKAVDDQIEGMFNPTALEEMLLSMMKHRDGWPFDRPITKSDAPDYHRVIKRPMDLGTIRTGILRMKYSCNQEVLDDIRLVFANCWQYNRDDAEEYQCGVRLEAYFRKEAKKIGLFFDDDDDQEQENNASVADDDDDEAPKAKRSRRTF